MKVKFVVDGNELKNSQIAHYRSKIGYVSQHLFMIDDTIAKNVAFGLEDKLINYEKLEYSLRLG